MSSSLRISGKNLGLLALPDCCERCFWIQLRLGFSLPYQIFPGIFSSIDSYSKTIVHGYFDRHGRQPPWLDGLGEFQGYLDPPHYSKFNMWVESHSILVTGVPDGLLIRRDGSMLIADYKTARFTATQDVLLPMYAIQLNAYALIAHQRKIGTVTGLALVYFEPCTGPSNCGEARCGSSGFDMGFDAYLLEVPLVPESVRPLLVRARSLYDLPEAPPGREGCRNCGQVERLVSLCNAMPTHL